MGCQPAVITFQTGSCNHRFCLGSVGRDGRTSLLQETHVSACSWPGDGNIPVRTWPGRAITSNDRVAHNKGTHVERSDREGVNITLFCGPEVTAHIGIPDTTFWSHIPKSAWFIGPGSEAPECSCDPFPETSLPIPSDQDVVLGIVEYQRVDSLMPRLTYRSDTTVYDIQSLEICQAAARLCKLLRAQSAGRLDRPSC